MEKHLIVFDLDGTMLPGVNTLPDPVRDIVRRLRADGHIPVIASARPQAMCDWVYEAMGLDTLMVCLNGSLVLHPRDESFVPRETMLEGERWQAVWERAITAAPDPVQIYVECNDSFWYRSYPESSYWQDRTERSVSAQLTDLRHAPSPLANRALFHYYDRACNEAIEAALADCPGLFVQTLTAKDKQGRALYRTMFFDEHVSKLAGVRAAQEYYGIPDERVLTFGDEWNDYGMIRAFDGGYALKGSAAERDGIGRVTDDTCAECGVAKTLERLFYS